MNILIGIPAFNEENNIRNILQQVKKIAENILVCDDGSTDNTYNIAKEMGVKVIKHKKNLGYGSAIKTIFEQAKILDVDVLITIDADGQHDVSDINKIIEPIKQNKADIVIGSRFLEKSKNIPKYRKLGIKAINGLTNIPSKSNISDTQSGFRGYSKNVLKQIDLIENGMGISTEILLKSIKNNFKIFEVPINISYNGDTSTHNPISHGAVVILSTMKFISIDRPLTFYGIPGLILFSIGIFFSIWTLQIFTETRQIFTNVALIGFAGLILGSLFLMTSILLFSLATLHKQSK